MTDLHEEPVLEEPEGIGDDAGDPGSDYALDNVLIRNENRTVQDVLRRIRQGRYVMNPDFQRDFIWDDSQQSKLIESVLMRIPLPVLYLAEDQDGKMIVVDGLQRLSTFRRFVDGGLRLRLDQQPELNRKSFDDLAARLQNRIEDCNLTSVCDRLSSPGESETGHFREGKQWRATDTPADAELSVQRARHTVTQRANGNRTVSQRDGRKPPPGYYERP